MNVDRCRLSFPFGRRAAACLVIVASTGAGSAQVAALAGHPLPHPSAHTCVYGRASFPAGSFPVAVARADLDGDGLGDLVTADNTGGTVTVLLGKAHGDFEAPVAYAVGAEPNAVAVADLDGNGTPDLVVVDQDCPAGTCGPGRVAVLLGHGDGSFDPAVHYPTSTNPQALAVGDFDGNGVPDLAVVNAVTIISQGPGTVSILPGLGDGSFGPALEYPAGSGPADVVASDFDGDGALDLAIVNFVALAVTHAVVTLKGHGDGSFDAPVAHDVAIGPTDVAAADLDGDGELDLVTANLGNNSVSVLRGDGAGGFAAHVDYAAGFGPQALAVADLDADGVPDLALTTATFNAGGGSLALLRGLGGGAFGPATEYETGPIGPDLLAADIDGDGRLDLVAPGASGRVGVYLGRDGGTLFAPAPEPTAAGPTSVATADFNRDGQADLAVANASANSYSIFLGLGDGDFGPRKDHAAGSGPAAIVAADLNADGDPDLVIANGNAGTVSVLLGRGNGSFLAAKTFPCGAAPTALAVADFDLDGRLDVAVAAYGANTLAVLLGNGDGTLQPKLDAAAGPGPISLAVADFDGDTLPDLAAADANTGSFGPGKVSVLLGHGDGSFAAPVSLDAGIGAAAVVAGDFDKDGHADLAVATNLDVFGFVAVLLGKGDGRFVPQVTYSTGRLAVALAVADLDGDHHPDLAVVNDYNNTLTVLHGRGDGSFELQAQHATGFAPIALAVGRFDSDLAPDVAVVDQLNQLAVFASRR